MRNIILLSFLFISVYVTAQPVLSTGGKRMPDEWIDSATGHKLIRLTRNREASNMGFYFHNNPFIGNKMVYYSSAPNDLSGVSKQEISSVNSKNKQIHWVDLSTLRSEQLTYQPNPMNGEMIHPSSGNVYYQIKDSVFETNAFSKKTRLVYVFPNGYLGSVTSVNANGTLLSGVKSDPREREIFRNNPAKSSYFNLIYEAKLPRTLFTISVKEGKLKEHHSDTAWLNHVQFSSTDPDLLMFCHEGPWHKVDRIWTIRLSSRKINLMHKRTMPMEIAGHEWFSPNGNKIWFDLQQPRSTRFYVASVDVNSLEEKKYEIQRDEWSIHFNSSPDQQLFCGDGGDEGQVAKAKNGRWIYLFTPENDKLISTRLVDMSKHNYRLEPNVHFSPNGKWVIFRANFEGVENVYAVEITKAKK